MNILGFLAIGFVVFAAAHIWKFRRLSRWSRARAPYGKANKKHGGELAGECSRITPPLRTETLARLRRAFLRDVQCFTTHQTGAPFRVCGIIFPGRETWVPPEISGLSRQIGDGSV